MATEVTSMDTGDAGQEQVLDNQQQEGNVSSADNNGTENNKPSGQSEDRKLFVGGLSLETTDTELKNYFNQYGDIESINLKTDSNTGKSRGFAFIVFCAVDAIDKVLAAGEHTINNKTVDAKKAKARHGKIFVGGLSADLTDDDIKGYFGKFGNIVEVEMPFDKMKNQRKAFCFITYDSEQVVNEILKTPKQMIKDKAVDVKKANSKPNVGGPQGGRFGGGGRGGGGGGGFRGGRGGRGRGGSSRGGFGGGFNQGYGGNGFDGGFDGGYNTYDSGADYYGGGGYQNFDSGYGGGGGGGGYGGYSSDGFQGGKQRGAGGNTRFQRNQPY